MWTSVGMIVAGIVVTAVAAELMIGHPGGHVGWGAAASILGGPALFLVGNLWFKTLTARWPPLSHLVGLGLFAAAAVVALRSGLVLPRWLAWVSLLLAVLLVSPAVPAQEIAVIDSAARQGVSHVIKVTSKASADSPVDRRRGQAQIEAHLEATGLAYTLLRSNAYMQNLLALAPMIRQTGGFLMSAGDGQVGMIDARDVAATAAAIATTPKEHADRTYWLTGPSLITYTDIANGLARCGPARSCSTTSAP